LCQKMFWLCLTEIVFWFTQKFTNNIFSLFMAKCNLKTQAGQTLEVETYLEASTTNGPHSAFVWSV